MELFLNRMERVANIIRENLKNFPTIEKYLKKSIDELIRKDPAYYLEQPLIRSIYFDETRNFLAKRFEKFLSFLIVKKKCRNIQSKISRLNEDPPANFEEFYSELRAAHYLLEECEVKDTEFSTKGKHYDILYVNKSHNKGYVEVESLKSLDPYRDIFLNKISAKEIFDPRYCKTYNILYQYPENERVGIIHEKSRNEISKVVEDLGYELQKDNSFNLPIVDNNGNRKYEYLIKLNFTPCSNHRSGFLASGRTMDEFTIIQNLTSRITAHCDEAYSQLKKARNGNIRDNDLIIICLNFEDYQFYGNDLKKKLNEAINLWQSEPKKVIQIKLLEQKT